MPGPLEGPLQDFFRGPRLNDMTARSRYVMMPLLFGRRRERR